MKPKPMRTLALLLALAHFTTNCYAQTAAKPIFSTSKQIPAKRTIAAIKVDGNIDEQAWKEAIPATNFVEWRPTAGKIEDQGNRTEVYFLYDNTSVYIGGFCHERSKDSISKELVGRDKVGVNDFVGVIFDTYYDKINAVGFYVTPLGEQYDAKYSNSGNEDDSWNAVWDSEAKLHSDGWSFEMRIPYSALRFSNGENQTWGLNITRRRNKTGQQYMWNAIDPKVNGFINQEGAWTGIEKIEAPLRLSFSPYFSSYVNNAPANTKDWSKSVNGGMDVKYGINESFTLDMTLIPDFGQVQSDNQVLNLTPFEVKFQENRSFFTEGTELFNKGNLFYSRRIGGMPLHYYDVDGWVQGNEQVLKNPQESKLINATKVSGRTKKGLGIGVFNAITRPMYAEVEDDLKLTHNVQTAPLTNFNIVALDQTLKNNSSVSFVNTNVLRSGSDYDANVSAAMFNINNKKNTYNWNGDISVSHKSAVAGNDITGYAHSMGFGKSSGRFMFNIAQELYDDKYDKNDMGIMFNNNYVDHYLWAGYRWYKPGKWYNQMRVNYNLTYSRLFKQLPGQFINTYFQQTNTNVNGNIQLKNLWWVGGYVGYSMKGHDFYEPRETGWAYLSPQNLTVNLFFESNYAKKYSGGGHVFAVATDRFHGRSYEYNLFHTYRFSDKFSLKQDVSYSPSYNNAGFYDKLYNGDQLVDILFARRNRNTVENVLNAKYNFNNRSGISFRARHYWSQVKQKQLYDLQKDGSLVPTVHTGTSMEHQNFNAFTVDAVYSLQFAPGSFINIVWKNAINTFNDDIRYQYGKNFGNTLTSPQVNNLSIKVLYYLDYLDFKKGKRKA